MKRRKSLKRLGTNSESDNDKSTSNLTSDNRELDNKTETDPSSTDNEIQIDIKSTDTGESNIWKEKPAQDVEKTREKEFEEYLADLFM